MIEFIQGKIVELTPTQAVLLTAGGVAYDLNISVYTFSALQNRDEARLYVYEAIREDAYILYGFTDKQERELFLMLISVPGIGGASARMILSSFSPSELIGIISSGNDALLKKVKGIGAKTAQRIIVDLHDKIAKTQSEQMPLDLNSGLQTGQVATEAITAMVTLGFPQAASQKVVQAILKESNGLSVEAVIREALKRI
ncbi:MAG: Holliday junction branch migration protein RuvA [Bacteroidaceae bacterium]|nr:Holliday junction branch migration protein RuvA [Bacteroidaceae bacterium]MBR4593112.1 Holliday junction branch migration protein RuvA [Bacteroidaceae bacterium]